MSQLDSLTAYLTAALGSRVMQGCEVETDDATLIQAVRDLGLDQTRIAFCTFSASYIWPDWPYRQLPPALLPALVDSWMLETQDTRDDLNLRPPTIGREPGENSRSMVITLEIDLFDEIVIVPDKKGRILRGGERFRLAEPQIWTAEQAEVSVESGR